MLISWVKELNYFWEASFPIVFLLVMHKVHWIKGKFSISLKFHVDHWNLEINDWSACSPSYSVPRVNEVLLHSLTLWSHNPTQRTKHLNTAKKSRLTLIMVKNRLELSSYCSVSWIFIGQPKHLSETCVDISQPWYTVKLGYTYVLVRMIRDLLMEKKKTDAVLEMSGCPVLRDGQKVYRATIFLVKLKSLVVQRENSRQPGYKWKKS